jgi:hypothetical protein
VPRSAAASSAGDLDVALVWAGEGADLVHAVEPAANIVERIRREATSTLTSLTADQAFFCRFRGRSGELLQKGYVVL